MIVDRFFLWVADASVEQRVRAIGPLVRALVADGVGEEERDTVEAALTLLADDREFAVRVALAEALCEVDAAPRHILYALLWDAPAIAAIVARGADRLIDAELIDAAGSGSEEIRRALAERRRVGSGLAAALAEIGDRDTVVALLDNPGADLPPIALERIVERMGEYADVRGALMARPHVPITVRHRVLEKLAEAMAGVVTVGRFGGDHAEVLARDAKDRATLALVMRAGDGETVVLVEHLRLSGQLTTRLLLRAACIGEIRFVEEALSVLAGIPRRRVAAIVAEGRETTFRAVCARAGMPPRVFPAFASALQVHGELMRETGGWDGRPGDRARFARRLIERVLTRCDDLERGESEDLLALLRRFAADAAREQARALVAEQSRADVPALAPPPAAVEMPDAITVDPSADDFESAIAAAAVDAVRTSRATEAIVETIGTVEDFDDAVGLFANVDIDDLPREWLAEIAEERAVTATLAAGTQPAPETLAA